MQKTKSLNTNAQKRLEKTFRVETKKLLEIFGSAIANATEQGLTDDEIKTIIKEYPDSLEQQVRDLKTIYPRMFRLITD